MRAQFSKKFYRQWKTVEGEAKWSAFSFVWGILVPRGIGAVITGIAGLIWPTELSRPWLYLYFFGMYVLCWLLIAAIMTIAAKGKQLLVDEELQERMRLRKLGELEHQIARGEIILNQYRVKDPTKKIDEQFPR